MICEGTDISDVGFKGFGDHLRKPVKLLKDCHPKTERLKKNTAVYSSKNRWTTTTLMLTQACQQVDYIIFLGPPFVILQNCTIFLLSSAKQRDFTNAQIQP